MGGFIFIILMILTFPIGPIVYIAYLLFNGTKR